MELLKNVLRVWGFFPVWGEFYGLLTRKMKIYTFTLKHNTRTF